MMRTIEFTVVVVMSLSEDVLPDCSHEDFALGDYATILAVKGKVVSFQTVSSCDTEAL